MTENLTQDLPQTAIQNETPPRSMTFRRSRTDRMVSGVCGGLATALGIDVTLLRVGLAAATVLGFGAGIVIYVACWVLVPEADDDAVAVHSA